MILTVANAFARYRIECPDHATIEVDYDDTDYLVVADPHDDKATLWLFDDILLEAARSGDFGLRVLSCQPLN